MNIKSSILIIFCVITSCISQEKKKIIEDQEIQITDLISIKCYLISLKGEEEIYTIQSNKIFAFGNSRIINTPEYLKLINSPNVIYNKSEKYGCGICTDAIDFKFLFNYKNKQTIWEIEPGSDLPHDISEYFTLLINKYKETIKSE